MRAPHEKRDMTTLRLAQLSWLIPLACLVLTIIVNVTLKPRGPVGGYILGGGAIIGFSLAVCSLVVNRKRDGVPTHAFGGLVTSVTFAFMIAGMLMFTAIARNGGERLQKSAPVYGSRVQR
jgi:hypothetical protein